MLIFATSDKGGTGRSVTSSNVVYRKALRGGDVCYLDFDFGSPTAGAIFQINSVSRGTKDGGLHKYLQGDVPEPQSLDVWAESDRESLRTQPAGAGRMVLYPGDSGGGEFASNGDMVRRCADLFLQLEEEFEVCLIDLSAGRSYATDLVLAASALTELSAVTCRWLVFHRWTRQHIIAAADLVFGDRGIVEAGVERGHPREALAKSIRFVRTAVVDPNSSELAGLRAAQVAWLRDCNSDLQRLASKYGIGRTMILGAVPLDPVLQWREQLISDDDVVLSQIANRPTVEAFDQLAVLLSREEAWEGL
ncbi:MAG TPA: SCO2523 family variant P-loop protein [Micromonosporaceae bacterium]|nr:SCO2523 family variant P-loop protein [Micromonosporaceae bacterium]